MCIDTFNTKIEHKLHINILNIILDIILNIDNMNIDNINNQFTELCN